MDTSTQTRLALGTLALATVAGSFALGAAWGGSGGDSDGDSRGDKDRRLIAAPARLPLEGFEAGRLVRAGSCADLLDWYVDNTVDRVTPWGWNDNRYYALSSELGGGDVGAVSPQATMDRAVENGSLKSQSSSQTGTNVQEIGVDEPDVVKTDGSIVVRLDGDDLSTYDVSGTSVRRLATVDLPGSDDVQGYQLLLVGDRAVVVGETFGGHGYYGGAYGGHLDRWAGVPATVVHDVDLSDPAAPKVVGKQTYTASLLSARLYDDTVRLVLGNGLPQLGFVQPDGHRTEKEALEENRRIVRDSEIEDWLPSVTDGDADAEPAVGCDAMVRPEDFSGAGSVVVTAYEPGSDDRRSTIGVAASSSTVYSSTDRLYLATSVGWGWGWCCMPMEGTPIRPDGQRDGVTEIHAFALDGQDAAYVGSGEVEGSVRDRWSMDSVDGVLRVAVGPTNQTGNANSVVTLREKDGRLEEIGRVDRLGINEQIMSVRWFDDLAVVVTFRQVDPLYAIDLADPAKPRLLGQLKIPGFSSYLHPIGGDLMIGIGTDADDAGVTRGGQAAVFDLRDLTKPRRISTVGYGAQKEATAGNDPRQFTWLPGRRTALTVVSEWGGNGGVTGWISVLEVAADGTLSNRLVEGSNGQEDVANLRALPLPDGRVVLSTEKDVRFLDL